MLLTDEHIIEYINTRLKPVSTKKIVTHFQQNGFFRIKYRDSLPYKYGILLTREDVTTRLSKLVKKGLIKRAYYGHYINIKSRVNYEHRNYERMHKM